jgi:hypothetical protein
MVSAEREEGKQKQKERVGLRRDEAKYTVFYGAVRQGPWVK